MCKKQKIKTKKQNKHTKQVKKKGFYSVYPVVIKWKAKKYHTI